MGSGARPSEFESWLLLFHDNYFELFNRHSNSLYLGKVFLISCASLHSSEKLGGNCSPLDGLCEATELS